MLSLIWGCREPYDIGAVDSIGQKLVIDAVVTDTGENGYIRLSYTGPVALGEGVTYEYENEAIVTVSDHLDNEFVFVAKGDGEYINPAFRPEFGKQYRLSVRVGDSFFQSGFESLPLEQAGEVRPSYRPDTVQVLSENGNVSRALAVTISDEITKADEPVYYHWKFDHYYIYDAYGQPDTDLPGSHRFCYVSDLYRTEMLIHEDRSLAGPAGSEYVFDAAQVLYGNKMIYDYGIHFIRYNISAGVYAYYEHIKEQLENTGGVFDASPSSIQGNIERLSGSIEVLGFFGVFNETNTYLFFNQNELPFTKRYLPTSAVDCPGHHNVTLENNCFNCTSVSAIFNSTSKPSWWR
ncbi:MAG: hypothetical protein Roseis2KO_49300 [Roseivirga sp.]